MNSTLCRALSAIVVCVAGCATEPRAAQDCTWALPIRPAEADDLTEGTARQILIHNETGVILCGWRP